MRTLCLYSDQDEMGTRRVHLTPDSSAALTRLVLAYCLGRGGLCLSSRSYALQVHQPLAQRDYVLYQYRRLQQFLPEISPPRFYPDRSSETSQTGQWRIRIHSRWFETAYNLLYPDGLQLRSCVLELLGAEAIAALWADRGWMGLTKAGHYCHGRLSLSRYSFDEAELIGEWISRLTGAGSRLTRSKRSASSPVLIFDWQAAETLMRALDRTWMAQASCLAHKFLLPNTHDRPQRAGAQEQLEAELLLSRGVAPVKATLQRNPRRAAPPAPDAKRPMPLGPPVFATAGAGDAAEDDRPGTEAAARAA